MNPGFGIAIAYIGSGGGGICRRAIGQGQIKEEEMDATIKKVDTNNDGKISDEEYKKFWDFKKSKADPNSSAAIAESKFKGAYIPTTNSEVAGHGDAKEPFDPSTSSLQSLIIQMESTGDQAKKEMLKAQIQNQIANMESEGGAIPQVAQTYAAGQSGSEMKSKSAPLPFKAAVTNGKAGDLNPASAQSKTLGMNQSKADYFQQPEQWGTFNEGSTMLDATALLQNSIIKENYVSKAWDDVNQNQRKSKELMMLFFYYAKLAESGDMGAIYQFMKFITYIISKDKAKQQIEMGKKLIYLQELSRQWTNKLVDVQSNATDANASSELMKTMTIVKSETDAIATSQKLISQMMEEFAQVVETLTNTTKGALETQGRILRTISTFR